MISAVLVAIPSEDALFLAHSGAHVDVRTVARWDSPFTHRLVVRIDRSRARRRTCPGPQATDRPFRPPPRVVIAPPRGHGRRP